MHAHFVQSQASGMPFQQKLPYEMLHTLTQLSILICLLACHSKSPNAINRTSQQEGNIISNLSCQNKDTAVLTQYR